MATTISTTFEKHGRYQVHFPQRDQKGVRQDDEWCEILNGKQIDRIRFHDYRLIFSRPGLYEQLFDDELKCTSPYVVTELLRPELHRLGGAAPVVLDLGAGNGLVGAELRSLGAMKLIGCDILPEAKEAALRDRPGLYDDYLVVDMTNVAQEQLEKLRSAGINVLTIVGALGFGDIPRQAFVSAATFVEKGGLIAFNLKEEFFAAGDQTGFSEAISKAVSGGQLEIVSQRKYCHRLSVTGESLDYYAFVAVKHGEI